MLIQLKPGTQPTGATSNGHAVRIAECSHWYGGGLWIATDEHGIAGIIAADSIETAYAALIDEMPTIDPDDVPEAYGFYGENAAADLKSATERAEESEHAHVNLWPDLVEGYSYQSNASGTGIVDVGHCLSIREMTLEDARMVGLQIRSY